MISQAASGSFVIDIADPRNPTLLSQFDMGGAAGLGGVCGTLHDAGVIRLGQRGLVEVLDRQALQRSAAG